MKQESNMIIFCSLTNLERQCYNRKFKDGKILHLSTSDIACDSRIINPSSSKR